MELSNFNIKKILIFSQENAFLIFRETKTPKKFLIFQETELSHISGNGNPKKLLIFQEVTCRAQKMKKNTLKKFLGFQKMELPCHKLKKHIFQKGNCKTRKSKISYITFQT